MIAQADGSMVRPARSAALLLGAALAGAGCSNIDSLNVKDSAARSYSGRATLRLTPVPRGGLEVEGVQVSGSDVQQLLDQRSVVLGGRTFTGPATVRNDATLRYGHFVYNHLLFPTRPVEMEWFAGIAGLRVDWTATPLAPAQPSASQRFSTWGGTAGLAGRWKISPLVAIEGRTSIMATVLASPSYDGERSAGELMLALSPVPELRLRLGYAESSTRVSARDCINCASDLSIKTRGPILGLSFEWR